MPRRLVLVGLAALLACGDADDPELVPFAEVCGQPGPVRLLKLAPGRQLQSFTAPFMVEGRRYFRTSRNNFTPPGSPGDLDTEVWSTGPCGEDPRLLAKDVAWVSTQRDRWPGVVLACGIESDAVIALDPAGGPPTPVMPGVRCDDYWSDHGVLAIDGDEDDDPQHPEDFARLGALVLHPYPADPRGPAPRPLLLHPAIRLRADPSEPNLVSRGYVLRLRLGEALALDADNNLLRFDLRTVTATVVASEVLTFQVAQGGRYLLWQHLGAPTDANHIESAVILQDRDSGTSVALGDTSLAYTYNALDYVDQGVLPLYLDGNRVLRVFHLPDLTSFDVPRRQSFAGVIDDHRYFLTSYRYGTASIFTTDSDELTTLSNRRGDLFDFTPERALYMVRDDYRDPPKGPLYVLPFDGSEGHVGAARATGFARLHGDHHLVTPLPANHRGRSELLLVDLGTAHAQRIATDVPVASFRLNAGFNAELGPGHLVYSVDDGERSGVYVARLPAP